MTTPELKWLFSSNDRRRLRRHPAFGVVVEILIENGQRSLIHARALDFSRYGIGFALNTGDFTEGDRIQLNIRLYNSEGDVEAISLGVTAEIRSRFQSWPSAIRYGAVFCGFHQRELERQKAFELSILESKLLERVAHEKGHRRDVGDFNAVP